jgi:chromosome partitioning protein
MSMALEASAQPAARKKAHVIAFANEKGGTGKTTTAVHVAISLLHAGKSVAAIDLDGRQKTFGRYIENRIAFAERSGKTLRTPSIRVIARSSANQVDAAVAEESARLDEALAAASEEAEYVVLDMPGSDTNLSRLGHAAADTLVTPMNDSYLDFDLLAKFKPETLDVLGPSLYSEFVWECRKRRVLSRRPAIEWVVVRNRVSSHEARNKRRIAGALDELAGRIGFRVAPGLTERVIFRELFPYGLTLLDLPAPGIPVSFSLSHVSAKQELRDLLNALKLPGLAGGLSAKAAAR